MKTKIKRSAVLVLLAVLLIPAIQSCSKYADGPVLSLRPRAERVANTWKVENYKINGNDYTSLVSNYTETFTKKGDYYYVWGNVYGSGTWTFQHNDEQIKLTGVDNQTSRVFFILKLEENTFWYYYMDGDDRHELHLVEN